MNWDIPGVRLLNSLAWAIVVSAWCSVATWGQTTSSVVFKGGTEGYHSFRIPAIVRAADGTLVALCEGRKDGRGDSGNIDVVCRRSNNLGKTWGPLQVVWDDGPNTCGNPCPVVDSSTGVIWLPLTHNAGGDDEREIKTQSGAGTRTVWMSNSRDHGATWTEPIDVTASTKAKDWTWYATGPGAGIEIQHGPHKGRLVIPCDHNQARTQGRGSHAIYSDDHGRTWQLGEPTPLLDVNECEVVELSDARLLLNMRNYNRSIPARQIAFSDDGGHSWRDQRHDPTLIEPICQASIRRVRWTSADRAGLILFSNPADKDSRRRMTVRGSVDDGKSWPHERVLYEKSSAYSCLVGLGQSSAGCLFEVDDYTEIVFTQFPLDWIESSGEAADAASGG